MAANILINRLTGATPTRTNVTATTNIMSTSDAVLPDSMHPIPVPNSGTSYSYWVSTRLECVTTPPATAINNIRWYSDGQSFGTGLVCSGQTASAYVQAGGTLGVTGTQLTQANHSGLTAAPVDVTTFVRTAPKTVSGSLGATTGEFGDRFVYQLAVSSTATVGEIPARTFTWAYDES